MKRRDGGAPEPRPRPRPRVWSGAGPRAVEAHLVSRLGQEARRAAGRPELLALPVRVVVPSRSLRLHLSEVLVRKAGAVAGLSISTLHACALEVIERSGLRIPSGDALLGVWVRRLACREPALRTDLDHLVDGYEAVTASVRDLLDAGLEEHHLPALLEAVASQGRDTPARARAAALVRVAAGAQRALADAGTAGRAQLLRVAAEQLRARGAEVLPARAVLVHGFADATGVATDFLNALQLHLAAEVWLDRPLRPGDGAPSPGQRFGARFRSRVCEGVGAQLEAIATDGSPVPTRFEAIAAPGQRAQWRAAAERARSLLDSGVTAERIAIVARRIEGSAAAARAALERAAVPYSAIGALGPGGSRRRQIEAALAVLREGRLVSVDRWLDGRGDLPRPERTDLRLALRTAGAPRLCDAAELIVTEDVALPVRHGLEREEDDEASEVRAPRRRVPRARLEACVEAARRTLNALEPLHEVATVDEHARALHDLLVDGLGWRARSDVAQEVGARMDAVASGLPREAPLEPEEWLSVVGSVLDGVGRDLLGGRGGGVGVLSVMEARGRTFDHLILVDLSRGVFPRPVREDPLLSDELRTCLAQVLPDLPVKGEGIHEERFLFDQLLASSPAVTLCWPTHDDDGRQRARSSLVERLVRSVPGLADDVRSAPGVMTPPAVGEPPGARSGLDWAIWSGLESGRAVHGETLEAAWRERSLWGGPAAPERDPAALAEARVRVLGEFDRAPHPRMDRPLGPYSGLVGPPRAKADPRERALHVTLLESIARCGWKAFVERLLRVEPAAEPYAALPDVDARRVGIAVHEFLDELARRSIDTPASDLAGTAGLPGAAPRWPDGEALERCLRDVAERTLRAENLSQPGLATILVERMRPFVQEARELDARSAPRLLGSEVEASATLEVSEERRVELRFRVDRVERADRGELVLSDFKTGTPPSQVVGDDKRRRDLLRAIGSGCWLQAALYARTAPGAVGRYVFVKPGLDARLRSFEVSGDDDEAALALVRSVDDLERALRLGALVPRVYDGVKRQEADACRTCRVSEACIRGDTSMSRRIQIWCESLEAPPPGASEPVLAAAAALERRRLGAETKS